MALCRQLSRKQLAVIDDFFSGEFSEKEILEKHKVSRRVFNKWQDDGLFLREFNRRITSAHRQSNALIAKYAPLAAAKLVELIESESQETARKACLDIISLPKSMAESSQQAGEEKAEERGEFPQLSAETAGKLLEVLAEEEKK